MSILMIQFITCVCGHPAEFYGLKIQPFCYFWASRTVAAAVVVIWSVTDGKQHFRLGIQKNFKTLLLSEIFDFQRHSSSFYQNKLPYVIPRNQANEFFRVCTNQEDVLSERAYYSAVHFLTSYLIFIYILNKKNI